MQARQVATELGRALGGTWSARPLGASGFCPTWQATAGTQRLFVKTAPAASAALLEAEADGLQALAATETVRTPRLLCLAGASDDSRLLAMEWLDLVPPAGAFGERLARQLAALHAAPPPITGFGWHRDNFLGATPQRNERNPDWPAFFASSRLGAMREQLQGRGDAALAAAVDAVIARLPQWLDDCRPSLIHGDLWQGNWGMLADGAPVIFDPAVSCSDAEAELAMMDLFGRPPPGFAAAYARFSGRAVHGPRRQLYQLYHLLNHALLFGGGHAHQALRLARSLA